MTERDPQSGADGSGSPSSPDADGSATTGTEKKSSSSTPLDVPERQDLPKWNRARVKRKAAGDPDAFQQGMRQAGQAAIRRAPWVIGGIVLVGAAVAGGVAFSRAQDADRAEATGILSTAVGYRARGQVVDPEQVQEGPMRWPRPTAATEHELRREVDNALARLDAEAPDSKADQLALLVAAAQEIEQRSFGQAEEHYQAFLDAVGRGHALAFVALEGLVIALEGKGDLEGAFTAAEELVGEPGDFYRDQGLWHRARLQEALGNEAEALAIYKQYIAEYPLAETSIAREQVRERVATLAPELLSEDAGLAGSAS